MQLASKKLQAVVSSVFSIFNFSTKKHLKRKFWTWPKKSSTVVMPSSPLYLCPSIRIQIHFLYLIDFLKVAWLYVWHTQADYIIDNYFSFLILKEQCTFGGSENQTCRTDKKEVLLFKYPSFPNSLQRFSKELTHLRLPPLQNLMWLNVNEHLLPGFWRLGTPRLSGTTSLWLSLKVCFILIAPKI